MNERPITVLFLCTGNSARSVMAEVILNELGGRRYLAYSAGSHPTGVVNPAAIAKLIECGHDASKLRSKSWFEFEGEEAPVFDYVITVCDNAARESCPVWTGNPASAHWAIPDPAALVGSDDEIRLAFDATYERLRERIGELFDLPAA